MKKSYWYLFVIRECVLCGAGSTTKIRIYDRPKPEDMKDRYEYEQFVCGGHSSYSSSGW